MPLYGVGVPFIPQVKEAARLVGVPMEPWCAFPLAQSTAEESAKIQQIFHDSGVSR